MSKILLKIYGQTNDFTMLHGFTSTHALRVLEDYIDDYAGALKRHWCLLQMAYLSTSCTAIGEMPKYLETLSWDEIFEKAIQSDDIHTHKIVYSLYEQSKLSNDDSKYRAAAMRKID